MLRLLQTLQSGAGLNADGLAEACAVSRRTVFRDIESLRAAGVPVHFDDGQQRYRIDSSHFLRPTNLTLDEALWLLVAVDRAAESGPPELMTAARQAAAKIEANLPASMRDELREVTEGVAIKPPAANPLSDSAGAYTTLLRARSELREVAIVYRSLTEFDDIDTVLRPYQLLFYRRSWYVIGWSSLHGEIRTFNVGRVADASISGEAFTLPASFSLREHLGNAWGIIPAAGPDQSVHLRFDSLVAENVAEVAWHRTQKCEFREDGSMDFYARVSGLNEIEWWILGYGNQVEVIAPPKLRRLVANRLQLAAAQYDDVPQPVC